MVTLSEQTAVALIKNIEHYLPQDFDQLGITEEEFLLLSENRVWSRSYLPRLVRTMNALIFGSLENMTLPKLTVPAEFVACLISAAVSPCNVMAMCVIMSQERGTGAGALELAARAQQSTAIDPTSADQLFALCVILADKERANFARMRLQEHLGIRIEEALEGTGS